MIAETQPTFVTLEKNENPRRYVSRGVSAGGGRVGWCTSLSIRIRKKTGSGFDFQIKIEKKGRSMQVLFH